jgi:hypothetical protein
VYYGQLHNDGHVMLSKVTDPLQRYGVPPGVMEHFETATRDPAFFRLHKHVDNLFKLHKDLLPPYDVTEVTRTAFKGGADDASYFQRGGAAYFALQTQYFGGLSMLFRIALELCVCTLKQKWRHKLCSVFFRIDISYTSFLFFDFNFSRNSVERIPGLPPSAYWRPCFMQISEILFKNLLIYLA